jgi:hypothetical protein
VAEELFAAEVLEIDPMQAGGLLRLILGRGTTCALEEKNDEYREA